MLRSISILTAYIPVLLLCPVVFMQACGPSDAEQAEANDGTVDAGEPDPSSSDDFESAAGADSDGGFATPTGLVRAFHEAAAAGEFDRARSLFEPGADEAVVERYMQRIEGEDDEFQWRYLAEHIEGDLAGVMALALGDFGHDFVYYQAVNVDGSWWIAEQPHRFRESDGYSAERVERHQAVFAWFAEREQQFLDAVPQPEDEAGPEEESPELP